MRDSRTVQGAAPRCFPSGNPRPREASRPVPHSPQQAPRQLPPAPRRRHLEAEAAATGSAGAQIAAAAEKPGPGPLGAAGLGEPHYGVLAVGAPGCGRTARRSEEPGGREAPRATAAAENESEAGTAGEMRSRWPRQERAAACKPGAVLAAKRAAAAGEGHAAFPRPPPVRGIRQAVDTRE